MKKRIGVIIFLLFPFFCFATHQVAGYIALKWLGRFTYQITIYDYTNTYPVGVADRDTMRLWIFDGGIKSFLLPRINGRAHYLLDSDPNPNGEPVCNYDFTTATPTPLDGARKLNIYQDTFTFTGVGSYRVWMDDPDRMSNINNIIGSVGVDYYMYSNLTIPAANAYNYYINSPMITNPPVCQYGCTGACYTYNPGAYIPDLPQGATDSIGYSLGNCLQENPFNPAQSENAVGYYNPGATINSSGTLKWCPGPGDMGIWNFAIIMVTYEKVYVTIGGASGFYTEPVDTVEMELEVNINSVCDTPSVTSKDTCVMAGDKAAITYTATIDNSSPLYITAAGEPFSEVPPATLTGYLPPSHTLHPMFDWTTNCNEVRETPYEVVIKATEKVKQNNDSAFYSGYGTSFITVVGPAPQHLMAENEGNTVCLHWGPSPCAQDTVYQIYRQKGCSDWTHGYCETGVPSYTGFTLLATVHGKNDTAYCDSNGGAGLSPGVTYSYIVDGLFPLPDGSHSYASNDTCVTIKLGVPIITNVSVTKTDPANGEMFIRWMKPIADPADLDTTKYPGPYKYVLEHATGMNSQNFSPLATYTTSVFKEYVDTTFMDVGLDTKDNSYNYKINFYDSGLNYIGSSGTASSIYLRLQREDRSMNLGWAASVPWTTDTFYVYREEPPPAPQVYNFIGKTSKTAYTDTGLHNGSTYCYYVKSINQYPGVKSKIKGPLYDSSETICGVPQDTIPPCPPPLYVAAKCLLYEDSLVWDDPDRLCPKANKTLRYQIYYTPVENGDMYVIATINNPKDTIYVIDSLTSVAGCYAVIAIDSLGQTSTFNTQCVDNCVNYQLPNVFTPNGDGINDFFTPVDGYRYVKDIDINIYNRWGQVVFHTTNPGINWNGNVDNSGGACPEGVYYYVCVVDEIRVIGIQPVTFKGFIELIRK